MCDKNRKNNALFISHLGMGDMFVMCGAVRYLRTLYSEVIVVCKDRNYNNVQLMYKDDNNIKLLKIDSSINEGTTIKNIYNEYLQSGKYDFYLCGLHKSLIYGTPYNDNCNIQKMFYNDINIDISIMKKYFKLSETDDSVKLLAKIPEHTKIIFVHNCASNGEISIDISRFKNKKYIIINPNKNMYMSEDEYFNLANEFIDKPILSYVDIIKNAEELHLTDSSFSCLAGCLLDNNKSQNRFLYTRNRNIYPDLFDLSWVYRT